MIYVCYSPRYYISSIFIFVVDIASEMGRECVLSELLYANDLVLVRETTKVLMNKFLKLKGLKTKV